MGEALLFTGVALLFGFYFVGAGYWISKTMVEPDQIDDDFDRLRAEVAGSPGSEVAVPPQPLSGGAESQERTAVEERTVERDEHTRRVSTDDHAP